LAKLLLGDGVAGASILDVATMACPRFAGTKVGVAELRGVVGDASGRRDGGSACDVEERGNAKEARLGGQQGKRRRGGGAKGEQKAASAFYRRRD